MIAQNLWRIRVYRMEIERLQAKIRGLTSEAECYRLARDCYKILEKHDNTKKRGLTNV